MPRCGVNTLVSAEYTGRGAGKAEVGGALRLDRAGRARQFLHAREHLEPRGGLGTAEVVETEPAGDHQRQDALGEVPDVGRRAPAIGEAADRLTRDEPPHGAAEVVVAAAVDVAHPHHERRRRDLAHEPLPRELRAPVHRERARLVRLVVRRALAAVEHVVGRHVQEHRAARPRREREVLGPERVVAERARRVGLVVVDAGERGEVQHGVGARAARPPGAPRRGRRRRARRGRTRAPRGAAAPAPGTRGPGRRRRPSRRASRRTSRAARRRHDGHDVRRVEPGEVGSVPLDRVREGVVERPRRRPPERAQPVRAHPVAEVVARPVGDELDQIGGGAGERRRCAARARCSRARGPRRCCRPRRARRGRARRARPAPSRRRRGTPGAAAHGRRRAAAGPAARSPRTSAPPARSGEGRRRSCRAPTRPARRRS